MSSFKQRSNYFKKVAGYNKLVAHGRPSDVPGILRASYHRINSEEELLTSCKNWAHSPCITHVGHDLLFSDDKIALPRSITGNHLYFLSRINTDTYPDKADAIEAAFDESAMAMKQFLSYMREDQERNGIAGEFFLFDLNNTKAEMLDGVASMFYGWYLIFQDKKPDRELVYDSTKWFNDITF